MLTQYSVWGVKICLLRIKWFVDCDVDPVLRVSNVGSRFGTFQNVFLDPSMLTQYLGSLMWCQDFQLRILVLWLFIVDPVLRVSYVGLRLVCLNVQGFDCTGCSLFWILRSSFKFFKVEDFAKFGLMDTWNLSWFFHNLLWRELMFRRKQIAILKTFYKSFRFYLL